MIRNATNFDKPHVMQFCKNTFSWGDYIDQVWDFWLSEQHLFLFEKESPVGICHASFAKDQLWIEGIRVNQNFRRQKIASQLVKYAESLGNEKNIQFSYMLIDVKNKSSLLMAKSLCYDVFQTWNFYSLVPKQNLNHDVKLENELDCNLYSTYVRSWRWLPITLDTLQEFYSENKIIKSVENSNESLAVFNDSEHFDHTLIVTLYSGSTNTTLQIISFLQNYAHENNYNRIQILTQETLPEFSLLEFRLSFHLMKKSLS